MDTSFKNQNFARYGIVGEISKTIIPILLQQKPKKNYFRTNWAPFFNWASFYPDLDKNEFSRKKELCQFLNIPIIYHHVKNLKKLMTHF